MTTTRPVRRPAPAPSSGARFAARARAARWRHRRPLAVAVVMAVALIALAGFLYAGPALVVREVSVSGVGVTRAEQVRAAASAPMRRPMAQVDTRAMAERVRALPFVEVVTVGRHWPSTLDVVVRARTPAALVPVASGGFRVVDPAGVAFASASAPLPGLPVVRVSLSEQARPALRSALAVLAALPAPVRSTVQSVTAGSPDDVRLTVGDSTVVWGGPDHSERKAAIYAVLRRTPATVYDLSSPATPVLR